MHNKQKRRYREWGYTDLGLRGIGKKTIGHQRCRAISIAGTTATGAVISIGTRIATAQWGSAGPTALSATVSAFVPTSTPAISNERCANAANIDHWHGASFLLLSVQYRPMPCPRKCLQAISETEAAIGTYVLHSVDRQNIKQVLYLWLYIAFEVEYRSLSLIMYNLAVIASYSPI